MLIHLDTASQVPIYIQIRNAIVMGIAQGELSPGERLPTIRALAQETGVNVMTVNKAYAQLKNEGYIIADRRQGATIAPGGRGADLSEKTVKLLKIAIAEAKLSGISKEELLLFCGEYYDKEGNTNGSDHI